MDVPPGSRFCLSMLASKCQPKNQIGRGQIGRNRVEASVARCLRTPPDAAKTPGLQIGISNRLRGLSNRSIVVIRNYTIGPITAVPCRAKARPLRPRRSYFAPADAARPVIASDAPAFGRVAS